MLGKVYLIGAGPGDEGLLTVKANETIKKAEVFVYDRLVSQEIMNILPKSAEMIDVGKTVGNHPVTQNEINKILLKKSQEGKCVVRLKGGDSFLFGRGGEELELLSENNIPFEVIPGITSAIAAAAYAGIPVTHRDFCSSLHIITGHAKKDGKLSLDYDALVKLNGTLVFMMSVSTVGEIAKGLIFAQMDKKMPVAVIENGTRPEQRKLVSTLDMVEKDILEHQIKSPAVIVVGKVCSLSEKFDWFSKLPLKNAKILITRPTNNTSKLSKGLKELGASVIEYPCIETENIEFETSIDNYEWVFFTSSVGVNAYFEKLYSKQKDARIFCNTKIAVVGQETANTLKSYGICADFVPQIFDGENLAKEILASKKIEKGDRAILFRADIASTQLPDILTLAGVKVTEIQCYKTKYIKNKQIDLSDISYVCFTSASTVHGFAACFDNYDFSKITGICIGKQTENIAKSYKINAICANQASIDSMITTILEAY